uniref:Melanocyte protein PMEL n=1 Tax=Malurus cyaneus samueli TaxID=2593467 RepID=A0A8C5THT6_9PASS
MSWELGTWKCPWNWGHLGTENVLRVGDIWGPCRSLRVGDIWGPGSFLSPRGVPEQVAMSPSTSATTLPRWPEPTATFSIALRFPNTQSVLPDGSVVWSQNCTVNGTRVARGDPVFPEQPDAAGAFPDGQPLPAGKRGKFVYVWWTWEGIESVAIVQVVPVVPEGSGNSVEVTVTCEGSEGTEVCTVVADAECRTAVAESCRPWSPSPRAAKLVLRQDFNGSGLFCLNVSLANGDGLAMATTRVAVGGATQATSGRTTLFVGLVLVAAALGTAAVTYR